MPEMHKNKVDTEVTLVSHDPKACVCNHKRMYYLSVPRPLYVQMPEEAEGSHALHWAEVRGTSTLDIPEPAGVGIGSPNAPRRVWANRGI